MGVHGLWRLIEPSGQTVPLETLENKVLAVDVSIWLHQAIKGFQDAKGASVPNSHLLGIYHRVCKLLYFKIKPVFVFDGGVPVLKKQTIAKRNLHKSKNLSEANRIQKQLLSTLLKHSAVNKVLSEKAKATIGSSASLVKKTKDEEDNLYYLPPTEMDSTLSSSDNEDEYMSTETTEESSPTKHLNIHNVDTESKDFKALPADVRHDILTDLKETRKQSSWGRLHELPTQSDDFSVFQMNRLLKRQTVQVELEKAEKEMGGHSLSLGELESLLTDQGVITKNEIVGKRIAADENTRYLYIKDVKAAIEEAKQIQTSLEEAAKNIDDTPSTSAGFSEEKYKNSTNKADLEYEEDLEKAIQLSLQCCENENTTKEDCNKDLSFLSYESSENGSDDNESDSEVNTLSSAQNYMKEYSGLTPAEISKIINKNAGAKTKSKASNKSGPELYKQSLQNNFTKGKKLVKRVNFSENNIIHEPIEIMSDSDDSETNLNEKTEPNNLQQTKPVNFPEKVMIHEVMSDSDTEDFLDVSESSNLNEKCQVNTLEILIKPEDKLDDDLFSDIFTPKFENNNSTTQSTCTKETTTSVITEEVKKVQLDTKNIIVNPPEKDEIECKLTDILGENTDEISNKITADVEEDPQKNTQEKLLNLLEEKDEPTSSIKSQDETPEQIVAKPKFTLEEVKEIKEKLVKEQFQLQTEMSTKERMASNVTEQMTKEAQELLELFGVPYIVAPMEAEAQCAFLDEINLTDGTITDDSDIWLFGGKTVYKNFFNQTKHVLEFQAENIKHHFKLTREQLILLALLVGSDYTNGLQGVGPVTALEILSAFPSKNNSSESKASEYNLSQNELITGLSEFRKWFKGESTAGPNRASLRTKLKNVTFSDGFPNIQVIYAYLKPTVETSREEFSWGKPDIIGLKEFARHKFGWTLKKSEEILNPVIKRLEEKSCQKSIKDYFKTKSKIASNNVENKMSKRVKTAVKRMDNKPGEFDDEEEKPKNKKPSRKKKSDTTIVNDDNNSIKKAKTRSKKQYKTAVNDEELQILETTETFSKERVKEIDLEINKTLKQVTKKTNNIINKEVKEIVKKLPNLHKKEFIPQREQKAKDMVKQKLKAIEIFRKSQKGPGFVKSKPKLKRLPKDDAGLSESSSDEN